MQTYQHQFLTSYSFYRHSLLLRDPERKQYGLRVAYSSAEDFLRECEGEPKFESALVLARQLIMDHGRVDAPTSAPLVSSSADRPVTNSSSSISKQDFINSLRESTGISDVNKLTKAMLIARKQFTQDENGRYIYTIEGVKEAAKLLNNQK